MWNSTIHSVTDAPMGASSRSPQARTSLWARPMERPSGIPGGVTAGQVARGRKHGPGAEHAVSNPRAQLALDLRTERSRGIAGDRDEELARPTGIVFHAVTGSCFCTSTP